MSREIGRVGKKTEIGTRLRLLRELEGLGVTAFVEKYGLCRATVVNIEYGYKEPNNQTIRRLMEIFGDALFVQFLKKGHCRRCGKAFEPDTAKHKFCSDACAKAFARSPEGSNTKLDNDEISELAQDNDEARRAGLSYGMYRIQVSGRLEGVKNANG